MRALKTTITLSLATLALGVGLAVSATPASAHMFPHPGGYWGHGWGHGVGFGYGIADYGDDGCIRFRPVYDRWGNFVGRRAVNVCE